MQIVDVFAHPEPAAHLVSGAFLDQWQPVDLARQRFAVNLPFLIALRAGFSNGKYPIFKLGL